MSFYKDEINYYAGRELCKSVKTCKCSGTLVQASSKCSGTLVQASGKCKTISDWNHLMWAVRYVFGEGSGVSVRSYSKGVTVTL
jgi:hypothetical protein